MPLTNKDMLKIAIVLHEKWTELTIKEIQKSIDTFDSLNPFDAYYVTALWLKRCDALNKLHRYIPETDDIDERYKMILAQWPSMSQKAREQLTTDATKRLEWFKKRVAKDFEVNILSAISSGRIQSPVEQFFLMEWEYLGMSKRYEIKLVPQAIVRTKSGRFSVDFAITPLGSRRGHAAVAIEIDGHNFHEKNREQVRADKQRERAIVSSGVTVLRFSGSEVVRNSRRCVEEVKQYLESLEKKTKSDSDSDAK